MTETSGPKQNKHQPEKIHDPQEKAMDSTAAVPSEAKPTAADTARAATLKGRKRTKTGCLTCRKRRIKCGEERPTCKNCVKSKRDCEGYIPRVIFKDPLGAFRPGQHGIGGRNPQASDHGGTGALYGTIQSGSTDTPIAPRLSSYGQQGGFGPIPTANGQGIPAGICDAGGSFSYTAHPYTTNGGPMHPPQQYIIQSEFPQPVYYNGYSTDAFSKSQVDLVSNPMSYPKIQRQTTGENDSGIEMSPPGLTGGWSHGSDSSNLPSAEFSGPFESPSIVMPSQPFQENQWPGIREDLPTERRVSIQSQTNHVYPRVGSTVQDTVNKQVDSQNQYYGLPSQTPWAGEPEDEYFDVDSDDDDYKMKPQVEGSSSYNLGPLIAMSASHSNGGIRSMTNFLDEPNVLATYIPSYAASPLMDPHTAKVFCHFITATAPSLAVCERRPSNPAAIFSGVPVPKSQRALWSYTLPMLALTHQGLLHAMLALASLHIAKLQHASPTPSLKHYHYALRRVAKALGNQKKRKNVATLAATLLLGFYEVTTAEHNKWNSHLSGARELIMDIDFAGMARKIETYRCRQEEAEARSQYAMHNGQTNGFYQLYARRASEDFPSRDERQLDENLISTIMGWKLKYNQYGQVIDEHEPPAHSDAPLTSHDIENYEIQADLFWWYTKQDMIQSLVSGNRLLLSYDRWGLCPPRAPVGRLDAVYGTLDHLLLLMGRLADFSGKDLPRKLRAQREAEKRTCPPSASRKPPPPQSPSTPQRPPNMPNGMHPSPPMYGYMPNPGNVRLPSGFDQAQHDRMYTAPVPSDDKSLETATLEAENEWASISNAFDVFANALGPAYAPLEPEHMTPTTTPFGPALYYRSYPIACILTLYYCGRIVLMRIKPNMPPAAMAACGVAAQSTAHYANIIGRICAGIQPIDSTVSINPHHGAALMDCCMGLFQAGVQYRDPGQRGWTITKLRDIARLTGWQTSALIASGCERAWMRAAEMGKGPPYIRTMNATAKDDRVAGRGRDPKMLEQPAKDNNDRRFITVNAGTRVYWALGILGVEEDMQGMKLD